MHAISAESGAAAILKVSQLVMDEGVRCAPRGMPTRELLDVGIEIVNPRDAGPFGIGRKASKALLAVETLQVIAGEIRPELLVKVTPNMAQFMNDGEFRGAYGPRVSHQYSRLEKLLRRDPDTRQAVLQVWNWRRDLDQEWVKDIPCTVAIQVTVRDGRLNLHTRMRSNDVWWGCAYDFGVFCGLQCSLADALHLEVGHYYHVATSMHLYERDVEKVRALAWDDGEGTPLDGVRTNGGGFIHMQDRARRILDGEKVPYMSETELWYSQVLEPFRD